MRTRVVEGHLRKSQVKQRARTNATLELSLSVSRGHARYRHALWATRLSSCRMPSLPRTRITRHRYAPCHAHPPIVHAATACSVRSRQSPRLRPYFSLWPRMALAARQPRLRRPRSSLPAHSVSPVKPRWPSKLFDSTPAGAPRMPFAPIAEREFLPSPPALMIGCPVSTSFLMNSSTSCCPSCEHTQGAPGAIERGLARLVGRGAACRRARGHGDGRHWARRQQHTPRCHPPAAPSAGAATDGACRWSGWSHPAPTATPSCGPAIVEGPHQGTPSSQQRTPRSCSQASWDQERGSGRRSCSAAGSASGSTSHPSRTGPGRHHRACCEAWRGLVRTQSQKHKSTTLVVSRTLGPAFTLPACHALPLRWTLRTWRCATRMWSCEGPT